MRGGPDGRPAYVAPVPAAVAGVAVAAGTGLVLCVGLAVLGWLAAPSSDVVAAARVGIWAWLLANGSALHVSAAGPGTVDSAATAAVGFTGTVAIAPLGLSLLLVAVLARTTAAVIRATAPPVRVPGTVREARALARHATRRELRPLLIVAGTTVALYVGAAALVAGHLAGGAHLVRVDTGRTLTGAAVVGLIGAGLGVVAACGGWRRQLRRAPAGIAAGVRGAGAGTALLLAVALVLLVTAVLGHLARVAALSHAIGGGAVGQSLLTIGQLALVGQGVAYALAWCTGAGFTVGAGTVVAPTGVVLGPLPAVPALGALPDPGAQPLWTSALVVLPAVAGLLAGAVAVRSVLRAAAARTDTTPAVVRVTELADDAPAGHRTDRRTASATIAVAAAAAAGAGLGAALLATGLLAVSRAQLGTGRLAHVGPVTGAAALTLLVSCPLAALLAVLPPAVRRLLPSSREAPAGDDTTGTTDTTDTMTAGVDPAGSDDEVEGVDDDGGDAHGELAAVAPAGPDRARDAARARAAEPAPYLGGDPATHPDSGGDLDSGDDIVSDPGSGTPGLGIESGPGDPGAPESARPTRRRRVGSAAHALLEHVREVPGALLDRRRRPGRLLGAGDVPTEVGAVGDEDRQDHEDQAEGHGPDRDGEAAAGAAHPGAAGLADRADPADERRDARDEGDERGDRGEARGAGLEREREQEEDETGERGAQRPPAGPVG